MNFQNEENWFKEGQYLRYVLHRYRHTVPSQDGTICAAPRNAKIARFPTVSLTGYVIELLDFRQYK